MLVGNFGGILGTIVFTYLNAGLLNWWKNFKRKRFNSEKTTTFKKSTRRIIKIKNKFGLMGIAILTPMLLSIPVGTFLAERFYKDKKKVIVYISVSVVVWSIILYSIFYFFNDQLS